MGSIAWHEQKIAEIRGRNRGKGAKKKERKVPNRGRVTVKYDFLKYIRVVLKWATANSDLTRPQIELMLYLYCEGVFSKRQYHDYHKIIGMYEQKTLDILTEKGWVTLFKPANKDTKEPDLYTLTHSSKKFCAKIHRLCCGVEEIPTEARHNKLAEKGGKRIDDYYMHMIKKMNGDMSE